MRIWRYKRRSLQRIIKTGKIMTKTESLDQYKAALARAIEILIKNKGLKAYEEWKAKDERIKELEEDIDELQRLEGALRGKVQKLQVRNGELEAENARLIKRCEGFADVALRNGQ